MKKGKVSFIVPVYNVEVYLEKCIQSILSQTYRDLELILVNDGSPDNSQEIINKYSRKDNRIIAIEKNNEGVSIARNVGLSKATGEYIIFVDSDDYIEKDYTEYMVSMLEKESADMAMSINSFDDCNLLPPSSGSYFLLSGQEATEWLYLEKTGVAVWNKIYRKELLDRHDIKFNPEFWFAEGMTFNINYFQISEKIAVGNKKVYHQTYNPASAVRKFNINSWYCGMRAMEYQKKLWREENDKVLNAWNYHYRQYYFSILKGIYMSNSVSEYAKEIRKCVNELRKNFLIPFKVNISFKKKIKWILITICPKLMVKYQVKKELKNAKEYILNGER